MAHQGTEHSSALLAAQQQLDRLRQQHGVGTAAPGRRRQPERHDDRLDSPSLARHSLPLLEGGLPEHLGWESAPLTSSLRTVRQQLDIGLAAGATEATSRSGHFALAPAPPATAEPSSNRAGSLTVKVHPDVALGMLRQDQCAAGRIWLLLRHLDSDGKGWIPVKQSRERLTGKDSAERVCGWRQLRNLLKKGEGVFWLRSDERIWLRSVAKVAAALDVFQLRGEPVALRVDVLTQGIGAVRAHLYASFHSGRASCSSSGTRKSMPLARQTIRGICRISHRTQRNYERKARVRAHRNFAIGPQATIDMHHASAWRHGQACFQLLDEKGKQGTAGKTYMAWQLPNSYVGPHPTQPRGQQKRINQELADLFMQGMTGNGKRLVVHKKAYRPKRFFGNGREAARAVGHPAAEEVYWRSAQIHHGRRGVRFWHTVSGRS